MIDIPVLDNEEMWTSKAIDDYHNKTQLNASQLMWIDVITAVLSQPTFDVKIGNMGYVFKNMIAKYVSSSDYYRVSLGTYEELIKPNSELLKLIETDLPLYDVFWKPNKENLTNETSAQISNPGTYSAQLTNPANGCINEKGITITKQGSAQKSRGQTGQHSRHNAKISGPEHCGPYGSNKSHQRGQEKG